LQHPAQGADDLEHQVRGLDPTLVQAQLTGLLSAFKAADGRVGELNLATLRKWAAWEARFGIVTHPPQVSRAFDPSLTAGSARP
jgi:hypothetical protein